ncbi:MAG: exodeoxyribonuclease VII small subunit [Candidatus Zixiibacteriota bacterium]
MPTKAKYKDFETAVSRLEEITDLLESGEETLEKSIELYSEGLQIAAYCDKTLSSAEQKIKLIAEKNGSFSEEDFPEGGRNA